MNSILYYHCPLFLQYLSVCNFIISSFRFFYPCLVLFLFVICYFRKVLGKLKTLSQIWQLCCVAETIWPAKPKHLLPGPLQKKSVDPCIRAISFHCEMTNFMWDELEGNAIPPQNTILFSDNNCIFCISFLKLQVSDCHFYLHFCIMFSMSGNIKMLKT